MKEEPAAGNAEPTLSVCCMTSGRRPALLAGVLAALADVADEVVVAVEEPNAEAVHAAVEAVADAVHVFPPAPPADRQIAWLFGLCSGHWVLNVDDDEVASPALLARLPELVRRDDVTHAWIPRRWLYPTTGTYLASRPWGTEFQPRLLVADPRFVQFSDDFHRPVVFHGPSVYLEEPLWHLDPVLNPAARRRLKAAAYERERPGMRIQGLSHNAALYVPELQRDVVLRPVPPEDREAIAAALGGGAPAQRRRARQVRATAGEVDAAWVGPPYRESLYLGRLAPVTPPVPLLAGAQQTVDVRVENRGNVVWRWGEDGRPAIRIGYRWLSDDGPLVHVQALRTPLPLDLAPGATAFVPVHVVPPDEPGRYVLELDLVHELPAGGDRWFGNAISIAVDVRQRQRVAVVAAPATVPALVAELPPETEPVVLLRESADRPAYGDYVALPGLRRFLLHGSERRGRALTLALVLRRTLALASRRRSHWSCPGYEEVLGLRASAPRLVVGGPNWLPGSAPGREWSVLLATALVWRLGGRDVVLPDAALPAGAEPRARVLRALLRALRTSRDPAPG